MEALQLHSNSLFCIICVHCPATGHIYYHTQADPVALHYSEDWSLSYYYFFLIDLIDSSLYLNNQIEMAYGEQFLHLKSWCYLFEKVGASCYSLWSFSPKALRSLSFFRFWKMHFVLLKLILKMHPVVLSCLSPCIKSESHINLACIEYSFIYIFTVKVNSLFACWRVMGMDLASTDTKNVEYMNENGRI